MMSTQRRILSIIVLIAFFINSFSNLGLGDEGPYSRFVNLSQLKASEVSKLSTPSIIDDIIGIEHNDMGRIQIALESQLNELSKNGRPLSIESIKSTLKEAGIKEKTIFRPAEIQIFFHEIHDTTVSVRFGGVVQRRE